MQIEIIIRAELSEFDAAEVTTDAVAILEASMPYMFDNVIVTSSITEPN